MWLEFWNAWKGRLVWRSLKRKFNIDYNKVVIVMPEKDKAWNMCAIKYLPHFMKRKNAQEVVLLVPCDTANDLSDFNDDRIKVQIISQQEVTWLFCYYLMYKFFDNIVFLYLDEPEKDNKCRIAMERCNISMDEIICLCFYKLRQVPNHV